MRALHVADVGDGMLPVSLRPRDAPPHHRQLAALLTGQNHGGDLVGEDAGHGREIAGAVVAYVEPAPYLVLGPVEALEVALHEPQMPVSRLGSIIGITGIREEPVIPPCGGRQAR